MSILKDVNARAEESDDDGTDELPAKKRRIEKRDVLVENDNVAEADEESTSDIEFEGEVEGKGGVAGRVAMIEMENFMCHSNLRVKFDVDEANCFFIGGPNGSGKSALFAALSIGLGGSASQNDRGSSIKNYIKEGCSRAKIRIILTNTGYGRIPGYGPRVIIERVIKDNGGSTVVIKKAITNRNKKEEIITTKRRELEKMLVTYGISLNNPIFWMTQDRCRQFLNDMKGNKLFDIFVSATELDQAEKDYAEIEAQMIEVRVGMEDIRRNAQSTAEERVKLLELVEEHEKLREKRRVLSGFAWVLLWAQAKTAHDEMTIAIDNLKLAEKQLQEIGQKIIDVRKKYDDEMQEKNETARRNNDQGLKDQLIALQRQMIEKEADRKNYMTILESLRHKEQALKNNIMVKDANIKRTKDEIDRIENGTAETEEATKHRQFRHAKHKFDEEKAKLQILERQAAERQNQNHESRARLKQIDGELEQYQGKQREIDNRIHKLEDTKRHIEQSSKDELSRFGQHTKAILDLINANRHRFKYAPVGPIGMYINVRDEKWAYPIEKALGMTLAQYVVDNSQDDRLFKELLAQRFGNCIVKTIVTRFLRRHQTAQPDSRWATIERMLDIDNDIAYNVLVDRAAIESTMLIENDSDARRIMDGDCPINIHVCYTLSGAKVIGRQGNRGFYRFFPDNSGRGGLVQLLKVSKLPDIRGLEHELHGLLNAKPSLNQQVEELRRQSRLMRSEVQEMDKEMNTLNTKIRETRNEINNQEAILNRLEMSSQLSEDRLASMRASIEEHEKLKAEMIEQFEELQEQIETAQVDLEEAEESKSELRKNAKELEILLVPYAAEAKEREDRIKRLMHQIQQYEKNESDIKEVVAKYGRERVLQLRKYDESMKQAAEDTADIPTPDGHTNPPDLLKLPQANQIQGKYDSINRDIKAKMRCLPSIEEVHERLKANNASVQANREAEEKLLKVHESLEKAIRIRMDYFPVMRHIVTCQLRGEFRRLMSYRGMEAEIIINFDKRILELPVKARASQLQLLDHKGLSGGERSYLTACFVMSLWSIMDSPFKCMDEFDVFMDSTNRKLIMELIVRFTTIDSKHSQFILFTPQGIAELSQNPRLRVFNMPKLVNGLAINTTNSQGAH